MKMEKSLKIVMLFCISSVLSQRDCKTPGDTDPCYRFNNREIPYLDSRHPTIRYSSATANVNKYCDLHALNDGIWYVSDYNITQTCVQQESCGSRLPIWLNGSIPSTAQGAVNRTGCVRSYDECCTDSYKLMIKNCGYYNVYCFWDLPNGCPQRYCFDIDLSKVTTTTTTTTTAKTTTMISRTTKMSGSSAGTENASNGNKHAIIGLSVAVAAAVFAVVVLAGFIVVLKKKLASSILPTSATGEKIAIF